MIEARWLGRARVDLASCGSTNDEAEQRAREGAAHGTVVIAAQQTAGRGRVGRAWFSPPKQNIYASFVLRPDCEPAGAPPITLAAGIGVHEAVSAFGVPATLKWPNDILVHGAKLGGILTEMSSRHGRIDYVILGVGLNVNASAFPLELHNTATSMRLALGGRRVDRERLLAALFLYLEKWLDRFFAGGVAAIASAWAERADLAGRAVRVEQLVGRCRGIDRDGALLVEDRSGRVHRVLAGDVQVLK